MQSLCTLTTSSDTFCTAVNKTTQTQWGVGVEWGDVGQLWERGEDRRSEVEGGKEETNVGRRRRNKGKRKA